MESLYPYLKVHMNSANLRALVIGCSTGYEIEILLKSPFDFDTVDGLDANKGSVRIAQDRFSHLNNVRISKGYVEDLTEDYDFVVATMVWEHIPKAWEALSHIAKHQPQSGILAIQVPRYDNRIPKAIRGKTWYYIMDAHLWYFTKMGLTLMLERCGYELITVQNAPRYATLGFALVKIIKATIRHLAPYFMGRGDNLADWDRLRQMNSLERKIDRLERLGDRLGFTLATRVLEIGFLNDAMTVVGKKR
ncbi:MAG: class I SAM-dependent methyltransferase [Deltaproteobacteria bacterium]|nr:class I SAM-dependent methyltransferase [Deltaproteobacteria bacterium]